MTDPGNAATSEADDPDEVAARLRADDVQEYREAPGGGGHPEKFGVVLQNGLAAIVKPGSSDETRQQAANEEAAWLIARALGWPDLVGVTVQRSLKNPDGIEVQASVQRLWGPNEWVPDRALFDDDVAWRVAVFDHLIRNQDRSGNNWIATTDDKGRRELRLVDHGHAFGYPGDQRNSEWSTAKVSQDVPQEILDSIRVMSEDTQLRTDLERILGPDLASGVFERAEELCGDGSIPS